MSRTKQPFTAEAAKLVCVAHEIYSTMTDEEERELLREHNSGLYWAYVSLLQLAYPDDARWYP